MTLNKLHLPLSLKHLLKPGSHYDANKNKENVPGGTFKDKKTVFFFVCFFVLTLLLLGLMSMSCASVHVLCHTLDFIPLCSPLFSANPYACAVV